MENKNEAKAAQAGILSRRIGELGLRKFVELFTQAMDDMAPRDMEPLLNYWEWLKIPGFTSLESKLKPGERLEKDSDLLLRLYEDALSRVPYEKRECGLSNEDIVKIQSRFLRNFGVTMIPELVWIDVLAGELAEEAQIDSGDISCWPTTTIMSKIAVIVCNSPKQDPIVKIGALSERFQELGVDMFVYHFCEGLNAQKIPRRLIHFFDYKTWIKIPGIKESNELEEVAVKLDQMYQKQLGEIDTNSGNADLLVKEMQVRFLFKYGARIPEAVWTHTLANELFQESLIKARGLSLLPTTAIVARIMNPPNVVHINEPNKEGATQRKPSRRAVAEERLMALAATNQQAFIDSFCTALANQPEPVVLDFEQLLNPEDWENLQGGLYLKEDFDLDEMHDTGEELSNEWKQDLAKLQRDFLKKHGRRIPHFVIPRTLAYEAMKEETYEGGGITRVLKSMGTEY